MSAVGVASPSAHGHAITSTATAAESASESRPSSGFTHGRKPDAQRAASENTPGRANQPAKAASATTRIAGTKTAVTRSANSWIGTLLACASSTRRMTFDRKVSSPTPVALTRSAPEWFTVDPRTLSPGSFSTGIDSPVARDSSTALLPSRTTPSVGIFSPGRMIITSLTRTSRVGTSSSAPSRSMRAVGASSESRAWIAEEERPRALASTKRPVRWMEAIIAPTGAKFMIIGARPRTWRTAQTPVSTETPAPRAMRTSMLGIPPRAERQAPRRVSAPGPARTAAPSAVTPRSKTSGDGQRSPANISGNIHTMAGAVSAHAVHMVRHARRECASVSARRLRSASPRSASAMGSIS